MKPARAIEDIYHSKYGCNGQLNQLCRAIADWAKNKGFDPTDWNNFTEKMALLHTEISEAVQEFRKIKHIPELDDYPDHPKEWSSEDKVLVDKIGSELADLAIRLFSVAYELGFDLEADVARKMFENEQRPHKHGRRC
jgi:NTP pyrophosphatase (non-canonical NTP hydrolase)